MAAPWSTTLYPPEREDGHVYVSTDTTVASAPCAVCEGMYWHEQHRTVEQYIADAVEGPDLFCVEASDNGGRSYAANGLRWVDVEDAKRWASGLAGRWFGASNIRVRACDPDGEPTGDTVYQTL